MIKDKVAASFFKKAKVISGEPVEDLPILKEIYGIDYFAFTIFHELGHIFLHLPNNKEAEFINLEARVEDKNFMSYSGTELLSSPMMLR